MSAGRRRRAAWLDDRRLAALATLATGVLSAALAGFLGEEGGVWAGLLAALLALAFFWSSSVPLLLVGGDLSQAGLGFVVLIMTYVLRLAALALALAAAARSETVDVRWLAHTLIVCSVVWVITQSAFAGRSRATL